MNKKYTVILEVYTGHSEEESKELIEEMFRYALRNHFGDKEFIWRFIKQEKVTKVFQD